MKTSLLVATSLTPISQSVLPLRTQAYPKITEKARIKHAHFAQHTSLLTRLAVLLVTLQRSVIILGLVLTLQDFGPILVWVRVICTFCPQP